MKIKKKKMPRAVLGGWADGQCWVHGFGRVLICGDIWAGCAGTLWFAWWELDLSLLSACTSEWECRESGGGRVSVTRSGDLGGRGREEVLVTSAWSRATIEAHHFVSADSSFLGA